MRAIAEEYQCPVWTASQTNRCLKTDTTLFIKRGREKLKIQIGDIKVGDLVETHNGWKQVAQVHSKDFQKVYKITLKSGKTLYCSRKHEFPTP